MYEKYYEPIYRSLESTGEKGVTVAQLARAIRRSKSTTWNAVNEMVDRELVKRVETPQGNQFKRVTYHYFQLSLFPQYADKHTWQDEAGGLSCECTMCGVEFGGSSDGFCSSCRQVWYG